MNMQSLVSSLTSRFFVLGFAGWVLATGLLSAQQFQATASGSLTASGICTPIGPPLGNGTCPTPGTNTYSGPITNTPVMVYGGSPSTGQSQVTASLAGSSLTVSAWSSLNSGTSSSVFLSLSAPAYAGVRLQISVVAGPVSGSGSVTVNGQNYTWAQDLDVVTPANGVLPITISCSTSAGGFSFNSSAAATVSWSYPGVVAAGAPTPGCLGPAVAWTRGVPKLGSASFGITCANSHPSLGAVSVIGLGGLSASPFVYDAVNVWIDPNLPLGTLYLGSNAQGEILHPLPLPAAPSFQGMDLWAQWLLLEPSGCTPLGLSGSNAIRVTLQS
ncbi:MAG: hypothetical protein VYE77_12620 [Planctomycetota bacterium]|nr:hypothetical protein [Planctomycetota bacterium]